MLNIGRMSDRASLQRLIERMAGIKVLCVGDIMLDHFIYGTVDRVSPEAPIPVLRVTREARMLGGAGNVARNATALGASVSLVGAVGDDESGRDVAGLIQAESRLEGNLAVVAQRPTTVKTRFVANAQQLLRADREEASALDADSETRLLRLFDSELASADVVILSDYAKGVVTPRVAAHVVAAARAAGKPVAVDTKARDLTVFRGARVLTPNARELAAATGLPCVTDGEVEAAAGRLLAQYAFDGVVVTRSERGMSVVEPGSAPVHLPAEAREVFDVSGAGDTALAVLSLALAAGSSLSDAAVLANIGAGIVVAKTGTAVLHGEELLRSLQTSEMKSAQDKVLSVDQLVDQVRRWRANGLVVGFTNGCFDLLHPGHVTLLTKARATCDRLIVGLNTDASVSRLKGPGRPVNTELARAVVLAALAPVDAVVLFGDDTPLQLIRAIEPDVLVKGADYSVETVVGAADVQARGGKVVLIDLVPGQSTTSMIERMDGRGAKAP